MKITGFTTCVGEPYAVYLKKSLPIWKHTLDELVVVTDAKTYFQNPDCFPNGPYSVTHITEIFTAHGASFNKGAALDEAFAIHRPHDWVLNFDADNLPPENWRDIARKFVVRHGPEKLYGTSHRYREDGSLIPDADFPNIWGFFHLWNVQDFHSWRRPVFDPTCGHAGNYDHTFMMQWPPSARVDLWPFIKFIHQGEPRQNWFGHDPKWEKKMLNLFTLGLFDAWASRAGHINVPPPEEVEIPGSDTFPTNQIMLELNKWTDPDPFKYHVTVKIGD